MGLTLILAFVLASLVGPTLPCTQLISNSARFMIDAGFTATYAEQTDRRIVVRFYKDHTSPKYALWISRSSLDIPEYGGMTIESSGTCLNGSTPLKYFRFTTNDPCLTCNKI